MPKLTLSQWILVIAFQVLYGLMVFAVTRDYYQRHAAPAPAPAVAVAPGRGLAGSMGPLDPAAGLIAGGASDDPAALADLADSLFEQGRYAQAIDVYEKLRQRMPDDLDTYNDLGLALHYTGQNPRAIEILREGTRKGPEFQRIWLTLGYVQANSGQTEAGVASLTRAAELGEDTTVGQEARRMLEKLRQTAAQ